MKKIGIIIIVLIVVLGGVYYLLSRQNTNPPQNGINPTPQAQNSTTTPAEVSINIQNFTFNPSTLTIKKGTKVTWTNEDDVAHVVASDDTSLFESPTILHRNSFSFTFGNTGSFSYHCVIHPMMKGVVVVQ